MARSSAFTLVEMMVVVVILAIAAACVLPQFGTRDDLDVAAAARMVMADLAYAQNRAIATQKKHFVAFSGNSYSILSEDSDAGPLYVITNPVTQDGYSITLGQPNTSFENVGIASVNFDGTPLATIEFDSLGAPAVYNASTSIATPLAANGAIILTTAETEQSVSILIDPETGEASVQ
jgi:prepilin-type N-terminal cleavage/methylation domain-containing protein